MKKLTLTFCIFAATFAVCYAGPESYSGKDKEVIQPMPAPCEWYRAHEWNFDIWATYAFSGHPGHHDLDFDLDSVDEEYDTTEAPVFLGSSRDDQFLNKDGAWGGGADIKYFWSRYFGLGVEGFILDAKSNVGGAGLVTFTGRYPIGCSRFAPYGFVGFGVLGGGSRTEQYFDENEIDGDDDEVEFVKDKIIHNKHARPIGQFGGGMEVRITRPSAMSKLAIGLMADFSWNVVGGDHGANSDFGMARIGLDFSY
ncbi:MAG: hypothetical protein ABI925_03370 [Verrucomicrobiota bacterium]